ncbi:hypothetical protein ASU31_00540 [Pedobacter ginsenosidimutans]|uniref:Alpha/beta hydrolase n=1 Tax=Pedobacter ginsenosidimutans TaxID=687842 RepID=A0A0T5VVD5_9SPHI|nr:alpha/beta hydrolase [Pedobacter ginsenosidimutans]KRT17819.1 hypothetical protein ASU31_00540 [Pedobacter ginsenosidimutans]
MDQTNALIKPFRESSRIWVINDDREDWLKREETDIIGKEILSLNLQGIEMPFKASEKNNSLSIARRYPQLSNEEVAGLAGSIREAKKIRPSDCILEFENETLVDIGYVTDKKLDNSQGKLEIGIQWMHELMDDNIHLPINPTMAIQPLHPNAFYGKEGGVMKLEKKLTDMGLTPSEASTREKMIDYNNVIKMEENFIIPQPKEDKGGKIEVFFCTNRDRIEGKKLSETFGNGVNGEATYGFCEVSIPKGHIQGEIERPWKFWRMEFPEWLTDHVVLTDTTEVSEGDFIKKLNMEISADDDKSVLIFIHGFNTSFQEAARRTAQIAWDIPFKGAAGFFSWPSSGQMISYPADGDKSEASAPAFSSFLIKILENTEVEQLHIIAHSMGSRVLTFSIKDLINDPAFEKKAAIIHQIVLAAPDIDQDTFKHSLLPAFEKVGRARTLYTSDQDKALGYSDNFRGGRPRLGQAGKSIFVDKGLDTVEASNVEATGNRHSYMFETKDLLMDLFLLFSQGLNPEQRRLKGIPKNGLRYWLFPK